MEQKTLKQMKASEVHRIVAAVLEVMEKAQFEPQVDVTLEETKDSEKWKMDFPKKTSTLQELKGIKEELGKNFDVIISAKSKDALIVSIEAQMSDFVSLLQREQDEIPSRSMLDSMKQ